MTFPTRNVPHQDDFPFLKVDKLDVNYDGLPALEQVSFELQGGEQVAVVGPNGAGKSTLFKVLSGLLTPTNGNVWLGGHAPRGHICIAYLPQRSEVDWTFPVTVRDVVMMGRIGQLGLLRRPKQKDWDQVDECLALVGLSELADRQIDELSGGQQQRMFIAQALAQEAELLMMDEPLNGLDITSQEEVFTILNELRQRGVTVMVATHDLKLAAERFDQVMLLNNRLIGLGSADEIFTAARLKSAYGGQMQIIETKEGALLLTDSLHDD